MASRGSCRPLTGSIHRVLARKIYKRKAGASALWLRGISTGSSVNFSVPGMMDDTARARAADIRLHDHLTSGNVLMRSLEGRSGNFRKAPFLKLAQDSFFENFEHSILFYV